MQPGKLRHILAQYGEINRIYLKLEGVSHFARLDPLRLSV